MCLIIQREPNFEIPYGKFETSILNNPDGYGLCFPDNNKLITLRSSETPDPEKLYRTVNEELKDKDLMIHLRYTTAGATNLRNAHPFPILEKNTDGVDLRMAHNGTLNPWKLKADKDKEESDTRAFVRGFVRPLFKRLVRGMEPEELLSDGFVKELLEDQLSLSSVLTFMDSNGNTLLCNPTGNGGKKDTGWYYSNTYSFNGDHRLPKKPVTRTTIGSGSGTKSGGTGSKNNYTSRSMVTAASRVYPFSKLYRFDPQKIHLLGDGVINKVVQNPDAARLLIKELSYELSKAK